MWIISDKAINQNTIAILELGKQIMANFDKQNEAIQQLALDVQNVSDEITELVTQIKNTPTDQGLVDANTDKLLALAQKLEDVSTTVNPPTTPVDGAPIGENGTK